MACVGSHVHECWERKADWNGLYIILVCLCLSKMRMCFRKASCGKRKKFLKRPVNNTMPMTAISSRCTLPKRRPFCIFLRIIQNVERPWHLASSERSENAHRGVNKNLVPMLRNLLFSIISKVYKASTRLQITSFHKVSGTN